MNKSDWQYPTLHRLSPKPLSQPIDLSSTLVCRLHPLGTEGGTAEGQAEEGVQWWSLQQGVLTELEAGDAENWPVHEAGSDERVEEMDVRRKVQCCRCSSDLDLLGLCLKLLP